MNELITQNDQLPQTIKEKTAYVLFGSDALSAYRKKLKAVKEKFGISSEQYKQIQLEAQETAENLLLFSVDIGKEMQKIDKASGGDHGNQYTGGKNDVDDSFAKTKTETIHDMGFTDRQARDFQTLAKHPETVQKAIEDARKEDRIVTRQDVLNRIIPPMTHKRSMSEMKRQAREEHKDFKETSKDGVVDFQKINKDKSNQEIIALDTNITINKALSSVATIGFLNVEDINLMIKLLKPEARQDMLRQIRRAGEVLDHLAVKLGGRTNGR